MNIQQLRADTPACEQLIHFNNAGASLPTLQVSKAIKDYLDFEANNGGYETAEIFKPQTDLFYGLAAELIGAHARNIAYTTSATDGYGRVLASIPFKAGDTILTTTNDYVSNQLSFMALRQRFGLQIVLCKNEPSGQLDLDNLRAKLQHYQPKLVAITHIPTNSGLVQPMREIGQIVAESGCLYIADVCQSLGQMEVKATDIKADFMTGTFRKFLRGPRGAGLLYVSDRALEMGLSPFSLDSRAATWTSPESFVLSADAKRYEYWEISYALQMGSVAALKYLLALGIENVALRNKQLSTLLRAELAENRKIKLLDRGNTLCNIITFNVDGHSMPEVHAHLKKHKINASVSTITGAQIDFTEKKVDGAVRLSPHYYNTIEEIERVVKCLDTL